MSINQYYLLKLLGISCKPFKNILSNLNFPKSPMTDFKKIIL